MVCYEYLKMDFEKAEFSLISIPLPKEGKFPDLLGDNGCIESIGQVPQQVLYSCHGQTFLPGMESLACCYLLCSMSLFSEGEQSIGLAVNVAFSQW